MLIMYDTAIRRSAVPIATLATFLTPFMVSSINIAPPAIGGEFRMSTALVSCVPTAYLGPDGIAVFVVWDVKAKCPLPNINLSFHNLIFAFSNLAALVNDSATFAVTFLMSLSLQYVKGFTAQHAGMILISQSVMMAVFSPLPADFLIK